jgi:hypothetical protein
MWSWQLGYRAGAEDSKHALRAKLHRYRLAVRAVLVMLVMLVMLVL